MRDTPPSSLPARADIALAAVFSALALALAHFWGLTSPLVVNDDVRQQIFWMQRWQDSALYPDDLLAAYASHYVPWGVQAVYRLGNLLVSPLYFSKILPVLLFAWLGASIFASAWHLGGRRSAWCALALAWLTELFAPDMAGGLSRGFAAPLLAWFLCCWLAGRGWAVAAALLAMALCIPYMLPVCAGSLLLAWSWARWRRATPPPFPQGLGHWLVLVLALALVWWFQHRLRQAGFGPLVTAQEMLGRPEFGPQGRYPILPLPSLAWEFIRPWGAIGLFRPAGPLLGALSALLAAVGGLWGWHRRGWSRLGSLLPLGWLLVAGLGCYWLAKVFLLRFFIPDRYLIYVLALGYCLFLGQGWSAWLQRLPLPRRTAALLLSLAALLGAVRLHGLELHDYSSGRKLYAALAQYPKDCLVAGHPFDMDNVLTFAQRPVLASYELAHCWHQGYWRRFEPRLRDTLTAYYAADPEAMRQLARRWGVCFVVIDRRRFSAAFLQAQPLFAPYDDLIRRTAASGVFAALQQGHWPVQVIDQNVSILDLRAWRGGQPQAQISTQVRGQP